MKPAQTFWIILILALGIIFAFEICLFIVFALLICYVFVLPFGVIFTSIVENIDFKRFYCEDETPKWFKYTQPVLYIYYLIYLFNNWFNSKFTKK